MVDKKIRIVTHNGGFHADDVFGVSALLLLLGDKNVEIIRSREQSVIDSADYVLDVGFVYDASLKRFDHHQKEGGGKRENGIPYASFGLIWKYLGVQLCGSDEVADIVERSLVQAIDAYDNGYPLYDLKQSPDKPFLIQDALSVFEPVDGEDITLDDQFLKAVSYARVVLERVIMHARQQLEVRKKSKNCMSKQRINALLCLTMIFQQTGLR